MRIIYDRQCKINLVKDFDGKNLKLIISFEDYFEDCSDKNEISIPFSKIHATIRKDIESFLSKYVGVQILKDPKLVKFENDYIDNYPFGSYLDDSVEDAKIKKEIFLSKATDLIAKTLPPYEDVCSLIDYKGIEDTIGRKITDDERVKMGESYYKNKGFIDVVTIFNIL